MKKNNKVSSAISRYIFYSAGLFFGIFFIKICSHPDFVFKNLSIHLEGWEVAAFWGSVISMIFFKVLTGIFETIEMAIESLEEVNSAISSYGEKDAEVGFVKLEINHYEGKKIAVLDPAVSSREISLALEDLRNEKISCSYLHFLWPVYDFLKRRL